MDFLETLKKQVIVFDGAMGTMVQDLALSDADFGGIDFRMLPDILVFSRPEDQKNIHLAYYRAGANAVETNTFNANPLRMTEYDFDRLDTTHFAPIPYGIDLRQISHEQMAYYLSRRACEIACAARDEHKADPDYDGRPLYVAGSIGPSNRVLTATEASLTQSTFDAIVENSYQQVRGLIDGDADLLLYETQQDVLELKAAVMGGQKALKEAGVTRPILCQVAVDPFGKMQIFNTDILAALATMQGIGIDVFGINCSVGPDLMVKTVEQLARCSPLPISVIPNAGLPVSEKGRIVYKFSPENMADYHKRFVTEHGVNIVGGCCGTTPAHIRAIVDAVRGLKPKERQPEATTFVSGPQEPISLDGAGAPVMIGERLNVRGSRKVREAVERDDTIDHAVLEEVVEEQVGGLGVKIIDVCMDSNMVDTTRVLKEVIHKQTVNFPGAMCIDSFSVEALTEAVKVYPGRPMINSISMEEIKPGVTKAQAVIEATRQHHPVYIGLATGQHGPATTADEKCELARLLFDHVRALGVGADQLFVDMNVFPIGSEPLEGMNFAVESLEAIPKIKSIHPQLRTICGVGNLTNGLSNKPYMRKVLTSVWLAEARKRGLDAVIINPNHYVFVEDLDRRDSELGYRVVMEHDMEAFAELEAIALEKTGAVVQRRKSYDTLDAETAICEKIKDGFKQREAGQVVVKGHTYKYKDAVVLQVAEVVERHAPLDFINRYLMQAMNTLGERFARGEVSLPHLLKSADVMKQVAGFLEEYMRVQAGMDMHSAVEYKGTIVLGTVYQDVHSIGKDLAKTLFENYGYRVIDLGVMTPLQAFIDAVKQHHADAVGMSALLVQTSNHMITVSKKMIEAGLGHIPVLIGGAPVNDRHAAYVAMAEDADTSRMRANVFYCATAMDGVNVMNAWMADKDRTRIVEANRAKLLAHYERATRKTSENEDLLRTLPRRHVAFDHHHIPDNPWFSAKKVSCMIGEFKDRLDRKTLYALNWKFGGKAGRERRGESLEKLDELFEQWVAKCDTENWIRPTGLCGVYPCQSEDDEVIVYDPADFSKELCRFRFDLVVGAGKKDTVCAAQYFRPKESGLYDAVGVQVATCGPQVNDQISKFRQERDSESTLYLQGLSDRCAEDMADYIHAMLRETLGLDQKHGIRWSPGYPAISDTAYNKVIVELLNATEAIGLDVTAAGEFSPTGSTAAIVCFHPDARYT